MSEKATITRAQAREALLCIDAVIDLVTPALNAAPYAQAKIAFDALRSMPEAVAGELGLEVVGACEGCQTTIFDGDDHIVTNDMCWLCAECRPTDAEMAALRAIQEACPKQDPECEAQAADDHDRCMTQAERDAIPVVRVGQ